MKTKFSSILSSLALAMSVGAGLSISNRNKSAEPVEATYTQTVAQYYSDISWDDSGADLKSDLNSLIKITKSGWDYDGLWTCYLTSDTRSDGTLWDIYSDKTSYTTSSDHSGTSGHNSEGDYVNREHIIPQSTFDEDPPMKSDAHHVLPSDGYVNGVRSSWAHGHVTSASITTNDGCKRGTGTGGGTVFEPKDCYKGDIARIYFYFVTCYEHLLGSSVTNAGEFTAFDFSTYKSYKTAFLNVYLQWAKDDPVSQKEIDRNNAIYAGQGNRNPYIDCPYAVGAVFDPDHASDYGTKGEYSDGTSSGVSISITPSSSSIVVNNSVTLTAHSSGGSGSVSWSKLSGGSYVSLSATTGNSISVTGSAVGTATIQASYSGKSATATVTVTPVLSSIAVQTPPTKTTYTAGEYFDPTGLVITRNYQSGSPDTYTYANHTSEFSFNPSIFTALTTSDASITITYGGKSTTQSITVNQASVATYEILTSISSIDESANYVLGLDGTGFHYSGTSSWGLTALPSSQTPLNYSLTKGSGNTSFTATTVISDTTYYLTVPTSNTFTMSTSSTSIKLGTTTSVSTGENASYAITNTSSAARHLRINGSNGLRSYNNTTGVIAYFYKVNSSSSPTLLSITLNTTNVQKAFTVGDIFNYENLVVTANYSDSTSIPLASGYAVSTPDMSKSGNQTITVSYGGKSATYTISVTTQVPTSISASVSKTYYVGETISSSDITVEDNLGNQIEGFSFSNDGYTFLYSDAASGGSLTNKTFSNSITYSTLSCSLTVQVQRKARVTPSTNNLSVTYTDLPTTYQTSTSERTAASGVKFIAYNCANYSSKMQFKASGGYFQTTQSASLKTLTINNRETNALTVYGSTNGTSFSKSITGTNDVYNLTGYSYVKVMKNGSGAAYCASLTLTIEESDSAVNLANYIMYEDTEGQCNSKFNTAKGYFEGLSIGEKSAFMTGTSYVIVTARERLEAWANYLGKTITYSNDDYVISSNNVISPLFKTKNDNIIMIITVVSLIGVGTIAGYFFIKRRRPE